LESAAGIVPVVSIFLSIVLVALSVAQFLAATKQRISADRAAQLAGEAGKEAKVAKDEAGRARDEARSALELFRTSIKLMLEYDAASPSIALESADLGKAAKVRQKLEEFAVPDEKDRKKWLESQSLKKN